MKLVSLVIAVKNDPTKQAIILVNQSDLSSVKFLARTIVKDTIKFIVKESFQVLKKNSRNTVKHESAYCHIQKDSEPIAGFVFCQQEYPKRLAYLLLNKCLVEFKKYMGDKWKSISQETNYTIPQISKLFKEYQIPSKVCKVQEALQKIDETKIILHDNLKKLLQRELDIDELTDQSKELSTKAGIFRRKTDELDKGCCLLI